MEKDKNKEKDRHIVTLTVYEMKLAIQKAVRIELDKLANSAKSNTKVEETHPILLTRMEVADIFKISTVSLDKWKRAGILPKPIKMAGRVYYLKKEIIQLIKQRQKK